jgi:hypothetical protein
VTTSETMDHDTHAEQHRGGVFFQKLGIDIHPHPYLGFALPPGHRSPGLNTDDAGFRISHAPSGPVDSTSWLAGGGGGLVLGSSVAFGLGASSDAATLSSRLASADGRPWLNLAVLAANSLQELIAAVPFLHAASHVVIFSGMGNYLSMLRSRDIHQFFGPIFYEKAIGQLTRIPLFDLAALAAGEQVKGLERYRDAYVPPPKPDLDDVAERVAAAARLHLRDLSFIARTARPGTRVVFALQPLATYGTRAILPEEQSAYDFREPIHGIPFEVLEGGLAGYTEHLAAGCAELDVTFTNVAADRFSGPCFITNGVLNDQGNEQAARMVSDVLG